MIFDYKAYSRLLNEFIIEGEKIEQYRDPAFNKILEPICKFLRISRISSAVFDSTCDSAIIKSAPHIYYDDGNADSTRVLKFTENNVRACKANYSFMQSKSGQDWSEEEVQQIEAFEKLIYTFCDRSYASTIAKDLSMFDNDLMVYPLTFFQPSKISSGRDGSGNLAAFILISSIFPPSMTASAGTARPTS